MTRSIFTALAANPLRKGGLALLLAATAGLLAGCQTDGAPPNPLTELATYSAKKDQPEKPDEPPMTRARAASDCWMKTEKSRADVSLDARADIVTKCIDDKMKSAAPAPAPTPKPAPKT